MLLPSQKRLYTEDFDKKDQSLVDALSVPLNINIESLYTLAKNNINLRDNIACTLTSIQVTVDSSGEPTKNTSFPLKLPTTVNGCVVLSAISATTSPIYVNSTPFITGVRNQNSFIINHIAGLPANIPFNLTIITFQN